jgi:hypothetical protein
MAAVENAVCFQFFIAWEGGELRAVFAAGRQA